MPGLHGLWAAGPRQSQSSECLLSLLATTVFGFLFLEGSGTVVLLRLPMPIPRPLRLLVAAQIAIQIGIVIPLSAHYFGHYSVAGNLVNLLVIPLAGILVPAILIAAVAHAICGGTMSWLAIPFAWFALAVTAVCFLPAYLGARFLPYPLMPRPNAAILMTYYGAVLLWVLAPLGRRLVRDMFPTAHWSIQSSKAVTTFVVVMLAWVAADWIVSMRDSPRLLIPDVAARPRIAACPMPILVNRGPMTVFNPGSESTAKYAIVPILRSVNGVRVAEIVCTSERVRSGLDGARYLGRVVQDAAVVVPEHVRAALSAKPDIETVLGDTGDGWRLKSVGARHVLIECIIGDRVVLTVPDVHTLLALARGIPPEMNCDVLVLPWRVSDRANSPSQTKFMRALVTTICEVAPRTTIVCDGGHSAQWRTLRIKLDDLGCTTRLIRTASTGLVIIGTAHEGDGVRSYRGWFQPSPLGSGETVANGTRAR